jgi:cation diffusion facilitator family transporter
MARRLTPPAAVVPTDPTPPGRTPAALLSIASNSVLILLKVVAGALTGSVAILSEAMHSAIDLVASIVAYFSVRKAEEPADEDHRYGHEKMENLAAAIEGMLILVGSAVIAFEAVRRLVNPSDVAHLGIGIAVIAFSMVANLGVSTFIARRARETDSAALEGDSTHLRADAVTSGGVLVALVLVQITGAGWIDPVVALVVAAAIVVSGMRIITRSTRVLVDEALPPDEMQAIQEAVLEFAPRGVVAFHNLRTRRAGAQRYVDLHVQFRHGTTLEAAHTTAHELQAAIRRRLRNADVLIHIEPEESVHPGTEISGRAPLSEG